VVDDIGLMPVGPDAAEGLYRLVDAAYERRSVAVSSNLHPSAFDELMPKTLATATVTGVRTGSRVRLLLVSPHFTRSAAAEATDRILAGFRES
jgi:DNA replication protein DnaC